MKEKIEGLTDEEFSKAVKATIAIKKQVDVNLHDVKARMYMEIILHEYMFDRQQREIEMLEEMIADESKIHIK